MKLERLSPLLVLALILIIAVPSYGYVDPFTKHEIPIETGGDDHPWGGDSNYGNEPATYNPPNMAFIWTPLSFIDFFQMLPYLVTRHDLPMIKGSANPPARSTTSPDNSERYSQPSNPGIKQRGN